MILRAAFWLGAVWLCMPHHPDLGLPAGTPAMVAGQQDVLGGESAHLRDVVIQKLVVFKKQVQADTAARQLVLKAPAPRVAGAKAAQLASLSPAPARQ